MLLCIARAWKVDLQSCYNFDNMRVFLGIKVDDGSGFLFFSRSD